MGASASYDDYAQPSTFDYLFEIHKYCLYFIKSYVYLSECFESFQKSGKLGVILHVFQEHLKTGWLTLLMPTKLEAKVLFQDDRYAQFSLTVDLLKNTL